MVLEIEERPIAGSLTKESSRMMYCYYYKSLLNFGFGWCLFIVAYNTITMRCVHPPQTMTPRFIHSLTAATRLPPPIEIAFKADLELAVSTNILIPSLHANTRCAFSAGVTLHSQRTV